MKTKELHGQSETHAYKSWAMMLSRCRDQNNPAYFYYGARGISFDPAWNSFSAFLADMGHRDKSQSLERIDNDGHYCKSNCRWAGNSDQAQNKRKIHGNNSYTGAQFSNGLWRAYITKDRRQFGLGQHKREIDAVIAYDIASTCLYPQGKLNFPENRELYLAVASLLGISVDTFFDEPHRLMHGATHLAQKLGACSKSAAQDVQEAIDSLVRWQAMAAEDAVLQARERKEAGLACTFAALPAAAFEAGGTE